MKTGTGLTKTRRATRKMEKRMMKRSRMALRTRESCLTTRWAAEAPLCPGLWSQSGQSLATFTV